MGHQQITIDVARVRKLLRSIVNLLLKNEKLLEDVEVREWPKVIYPFAIGYGDSFTKDFFESLYSKLS